MIKQPLVLVPVDIRDTGLTPSSRTACRWAAAVAEGRDLTLLHAVEPPPFWDAQDDPSLEDRRRTAVAILDRERRALFGDDPTIGSQVIVGRAPRVLCTVAEAEHPDLVVMGTQGFDRLDHVFYGSPPDHVIRTGRFDVVVVPTGTAPGPVRCAVALRSADANQERLLDATRAARARGTLHLIRVAACPSHEWSDTPPVAESLAGRRHRERRRADVDATEVTSTRWGHVIPDAVVDPEMPQAIARYLAEIDADLVVTAGTDASRLEELVFGGPSDMLRHASLPILFAGPHVVRRGEWPRLTPPKRAPLESGPALA